MYSGKIAVPPGGGGIREKYNNIYFISIRYLNTKKKNKIKSNATIQNEKIYNK
jgi:hypothetical protein